MQSLLDIIGAAAIGGILIVSMLNAMFTMQASGNNLNNYLQLIKISEDVTDVLDSLYLAKVGSGVDSLTPITVYTNNRFEFLTKSSFGSSLDTILIAQEDSTSKGYPLKVYRNSVLEMGPFWLGDSLQFTYYDKSEQVTNIADSIHSIKMSAEFISPRIPSDKKIVVLKNEIVIWEYFTSIYLRTM